MARVFYGVWNGVVHNNRNVTPFDIPIASEFKGIDTFNEGNPIRAFFSDKGFLVFDPEVNLLDALWRHMAKAALESCGKCTPCRVGTRLVLNALDQLRQGKQPPGSWDEIRMLAEQIGSTSLCGLGQTCTTALIGAFDHFRGKLEEDAATNQVPQQYGMAYMTSPCIEACPAKVDVPSYISYLRNGKPTHSLGVILQKYPMAATCGRVCIRFCEMACRRNLVDEAVNIKSLKRYVADYQRNTNTFSFSKSMAEPSQPDNLRVAVVGAGPAGVNCAYHLLLKGYHVDVLEASQQAGGMAERGIPSYRLPKEILKSETDIIESLGGKFRYGMTMGRDFSVNSLFEQGYKSIFLSLGCAQGALLGASGEDPSLEGYASGIDFLLQVHKHVDGTRPMRLSGDVVVVGGGNVAMDCVRSAIRLGADRVHLIYRRTREDMPADKEEITAAEKEGVIFHFLTHPMRIVAEDGRLKEIEVVTMRQTAPDASGRRGVEPTPGTERLAKCDLLIAAIGQQIDRTALTPEDDIKVNKRGLIEVDPATQATSRPGVFAGGDCTLGPATLVHAMANGLNGARCIDYFLRYGRVRFSPTGRIQQILKDNKMLAGECMEIPVKSQVRIHHPELDPEVRRQMFGEVEQPITAAQAYSEAERCLRCYRVYSVITESPIPEGQTLETQPPAAP